MEKTIEIPFGAKDSELKGWEYTIPEGMEAEIKDGKVIVREKENEDERIRQELIEYLIHRADVTVSVNEANDYKRYIDYLEKLKDEAQKQFNLGVQTGREDAMYEIEKEQKSAEWSEEYRKEDLRTRFAFYTYKDEDSVLYLSNVFVEETSRNKGFGTKILQAAEMVAQTIGALTIRLKVKQNTPANDWYRRHGYGYLVFEDGYDWLEKNLEYLKPKQEWSERDKLHLNNAILVAKKEWGVNSYTARFLEALRDNYKKCNSRWKPSEEQIDTMKYTLGNRDFYKLKAEIEKRLKNIRDYINGAGMKYKGPAFYKARGKESAYDALLSIITSLQQEQPAADLDKEIHEKSMELHTAPCYEELANFARHFYELGLNARKEE